MVTSKKTLEKIREIIENKYNQLILSVLGKSVFSNKELKILKDSGIDISNKESLFELCYIHNFLNNPITKDSPTSIEDMRTQQSIPGLKPEGEAHDYTIENLNDKTRQLIDKLRLDISTKIEGIIRENNDNYKLNALSNLDRSDLADELVKESSLGRVKQKLRDSIKDSDSDWQRVITTEMSQAIGMGSTDKIVSNNKGSDLNEIYVYRIPVQDSATCKNCRRFYGDAGEAPKVYKLSTLLANGSNYGKKQDQLLPVVGATHPNTRTSQIIELKPGFMVKPGGSVTYIGLDKWKNYIQEILIK